ncbi:rhodanese-like domain-containing protein [Paenibacillus aestuarii]|uniref:Rhodanese-like domain-containing protein n=1 Tax=Paenibacillus aestuarii TaxID=516965 RepID=A0ABW0KIS2_9BACL|nr:rhodanese-like domain-containing protein [Paenibacillus aestuarii]
MIYGIQRIRPIQGLTKIDAAALAALNKENHAKIKILDVRDQNDYYSGHIKGSISISLGRLPYVKKTGLYVEDKIVIIADSKYQCRKAARLLQKEGYHHLFYLENGMDAYRNFEEMPQSLCFLRSCK